MKQSKLLKHGDWLNIYTCEDTFVRNGKFSDQNFCSEERLQCKSEESDEMFRKVLFKFDLSSIKESDFSVAVLYIYSVATGELGEFELYENDASSWDETTVTMNTCPKEGKFIKRFATSRGADMIDVTCFLKDALKQGKTQVGITVVGGRETPLRQDFASSKSADERRHPCLQLLCGENSFVKSLPHDHIYGTADVWENAQRLVDEYFEHYKNWGPHTGGMGVEPLKEDPEEYCVDVLAKDVVATPKYSTFPSRMMETIKGYTPKVSQVDKFGGDIRKTYEATGFFYTKEIDGRWMLIDPLGHPYFNSGVCTLVAGHSENQKKTILEKYGSFENWGKEISKRFKELRIGSTGGASDIEYINSCDDPINMMISEGFISGYGRKHGLVERGFGCWEFINNNAMPVFNPDFVEFADTLAKEMTEPWKENPYFIGYMSDNEIAVEPNTLKSFLGLDPAKPENAYSYAFAWTWLSKVTGKDNPTFADITPEISEQFRGAVYDRYFYVVSNAIKKHDPNHLYMGCRFKDPGWRSEHIMRAEGYYCDICTHNFYFCWSPESDTMANWANWNKKPFIVSEFYAKGMDTGFPNRYGAGWICPTQTERTQFFENYVLKLLESTNCVGFHWFRYIDCEPYGSGTSTVDNDSNKGMVRSDCSEYEELVAAMYKVCSNAYNLIDFFNARREK